MKRRLVFVGAVLIPASALVVVTAVLAMAFALQSDLAFLGQRARQTLRLQKDLRAETVALKDGIAALEREPAPVVAAAAESSVVAEQLAVGTVEANVDAPSISRAAAPRHRVATAAARVVKVAATAPPECVFKSGDPYDLAECIRSQQDRIAEAVTYSMYR